VGGGEAFDLLEVVDVVTGHCFDDGPEGHGSAFGVGGGAVTIVLGDGGEVEEIPVAGGLEEREGGFEVIGAVALGPGLLVEGLDDGVGLIGRSREGLAEAEGEDELAVGEMGGDLADAPLVGRGTGVDLCACEGSGEGVETF